MQEIGYEIRHGGQSLEGNGIDGLVLEGAAAGNSRNTLNSQEWQMADGASIATAISSVKTALEIAKLIRESGTTLKTAELQLRLTNVISALVDARSDLIATQDELRHRDARIVELQLALEDKATLVRINDAYYRVGEDGSHHGAPYCTRCWEADHLLRSLVTLGMGHTRCPACQNNYEEARTGTFA